MATERTHTVSVRLSPAEHEQWQAAAAEAGRGQLGAWARDQVNESLAPELPRRQRNAYADALRKIADGIEGNRSA